MWTKRALHHLIQNETPRLPIHRGRQSRAVRPSLHGESPIEWATFRPAARFRPSIPSSRLRRHLDCAGSGDADRKTADAQGRVRVPPDDPSYTLRRLWLTKEQENGYYYGLANEGLWPLCHVAYTRPVFDPRALGNLSRGQRLFARAVIEEADGKPTFVFIQDYHFGLLPRMLKEAGEPNFIVAQFWHIPWPNEETFEPFPGRKNCSTVCWATICSASTCVPTAKTFSTLVDRASEARSIQERCEIIRGGKATVVRPFPISIDAEGHTATAQSPTGGSADGPLAAADRHHGRTHRHRHRSHRLHQGHPGTPAALDQFLDKNPEYREQVIFVQIGVPSRIHVPRLQTARRRD